MRKKNINFNQKILMGPGPTNIDDKIKKALSREPISHLDPDFFGIFPFFLIRGIYNEITGCFGGV